MKIDQMEIIPRTPLENRSFGTGPCWARGSDFQHNLRIQTFKALVIFIVILLTQIPNTAQVHR